MRFVESGRADAEALAALHVACWAETYGDLLPASEVARYDLAFRFAQWSRVLADGVGRVAHVAGAGFAMMGPQRDEALKAAYPEELYALYVLQSWQGRGLGRGLLHAVRGGAFTATVVAGNLRAERFYAAAGGQELARRVEEIDGQSVTEVVLGFAALRDRRTPA